jgi:hypothetical protein
MGRTLSGALKIAKTSEAQTSDEGIGDTLVSALPRATVAGACAHQSAIIRRHLSTTALLPWGIIYVVTVPAGRVLQLGNELEIMDIAMQIGIRGRGEGEGDAKPILCLDSPDLETDEDCRYWSSALS